MGVCWFLLSRPSLSQTAPPKKHGDDHMDPSHEISPKSETAATIEEKPNTESALIGNEPKTIGEEYQATERISEDRSVSFPIDI